MGGSGEWGSEGRDLHDLGWGSADGGADDCGGFDDDHRAVEFGWGEVGGLEYVQE